MKVELERRIAQYSYTLNLTMDYGELELLYRAVKYWSRSERGEGTLGSLLTRLEENVKSVDNP